MLILGAAECGVVEGIHAAVNADAAAARDAIGGSGGSCGRVFVFDFGEFENGSGDVTRNEQRFRVDHV